MSELPVSLLLHSTGSRCGYCNNRNDADLSITHGKMYKISIDRRGDDGTPNNVGAPEEGLVTWVVLQGGRLKK